MEQGRGDGGVSTRAVAWLAWSLWALCVVLFALTMVFLFLSPPITTSDTPETPEPLIVLFRVMALSFPTVGAFVAWRRPKNPIGWILCGTGLLSGVRVFAEVYADLGLAGRPGLLPGVEYMAWIASWMGAPVVLLATVLLLLVFPDGKLIDRAWWAVVGMAVGGAALLAPSMALDPYPTLAYHPIPNPFALESDVYENVIGRLGSLGLVLLIVSMLCAGVSILIRVDKGSRVERQQIKWLAYSFTLMIIGLTFLDAGLWALILTVAAFNSLPLAVGIAVLRYRLIDIDVVINRTLVYGALTVMLAAVYFGSILLLERIGSLVYQAPFRALIGQESALAVVASTLAIAALFNPLRHRIQSFIDRRFYRRKYDARKTLEAFSAKLRDETDLDALNAELVGVVRETMQPAHVSLWLRPDTPPKKDDVPD
jgi:hypothetical protein